MKRYWIGLLAGCILLIGIYCFSKETAEVSVAGNEIIMIDCGHGGIDPGMIGTGGLLEKDFNLAIGLKLKESLQEKGYEVVMTRETDTGLYEEDTPNKKAQDMQKRILLMQEIKPALTISIHQNSYEDPSVKGPQVFYYKDSSEGEKLAVILQEKLNEKLEVERPREAKGNTSYYLLKRSPGILNIVECGFLTNPDEAEKLGNEKYQEKIADSITEGVEEYFTKK